MPHSIVTTVVDPLEYQSSVRASEQKIVITGSGRYQAKLTQIHLHRLHALSGSESLPSVTHAAVRKDRAAIGFLTDAEQPPLTCSGVELTPGEFLFYATGAEQ